MRNRVLFAFALAPLAATAVLWAWLAVSGQVPNPAFTFSVLWYAYITAGIFGVPAYFLTSSRNLHAPYGHALIGALIGVVPAGLLSRFTTHSSFIIGIVVASAAAGLVFGLIARRNLTIVGGDREAR
jgi:FtsH-binding integral membrane protein